jgi:glutamate formiminotransferase/formiminotetrahydrofolate cyclodeaminase
MSGGKSFLTLLRRVKRYRIIFLQMVDEDTLAFNRLMGAYSLPKKSEEEKNIREIAIRDATKNAITLYH